MGEYCETCDASDVWDEAASTLRHPNGRFVRAATEDEAREHMVKHAHEAPEPEPATEETQAIDETTSSAPATDESSSPATDADSGFEYVGAALDPDAP